LSLDAGYNGQGRGADWGGEGFVLNGADRASSLPRVSPQEVIKASARQWPKDEAPTGPEKLLSPKKPYNLLAATAVGRGVHLFLVGP
jgi:hypothetical protein